LITEQLIVANIVKLTSQNFSQVGRFKLLFRDISLRTFFLNGAHFDKREGVEIFPQYICELTICAVKMIRESTSKKVVV